MRYKVLKSGPDGICAGGLNYTRIEDVLSEILHYKGWASLDALHQAIVTWASDAEPGDVYCTPTSAIVVVSPTRHDFEDDICHLCGHEGLDYQELSPVEGGDIEQEVTCPGCGERWMDVFTLIAQRSLCKVKPAQE